MKWVRSTAVANTKVNRAIKAISPGLALSLLPISTILSKKWPMKLPPKNQEKHPESQKVSIPTHPERKTTINVHTLLTSVPPKNQKEVDGKKKDEKANDIQSMDEHKIPLEELLYRFGANL